MRTCWLEVVLHIEIEFFIVLCFEHFAENGGDGCALHLAREPAGVGEETEHGSGADRIFDITDSAPLDAEADDGLENAVVSSAIDSELAPVVVCNEVHESVVFFGGSLGVFITELIEEEFFGTWRLRTEVRSTGRGTSSR